MAPRTTRQCRPAHRAPETEPLTQRAPEKQDLPEIGRRAGGSTAALAARLWREFLSPYRGKLMIALIAMSVYALTSAAIPAGVE